MYYFDIGTFNLGGSLWSDLPIFVYIYIMCSIFNFRLYLIIPGTPPRPLHIVPVHSACLPLTLVASTPPPFPPHGVQWWGGLWKEAVGCWHCILFLFSVITVMWSQYSLSSSMVKVRVCVWSPCHIWVWWSVESIHRAQHWVLLTANSYYRTRERHQQREKAWAAKPRGQGTGFHKPSPWGHTRLA